MLIQLEHLIEISALLPFGWFSENVCFIVVACYPLPTHSICEDTVVDVCVSYPSPTHSVCEDTLVGMFVCDQSID